MREMKALRKTALNCSSSPPMPMFRKSQSALMTDRRAVFLFNQLDSIINFIIKCTYITKECYPPFRLSRQIYGGFLGSIEDDGRVWITHAEKGLGSFRFFSPSIHRSHIRSCMINVIGQWWNVCGKRAIEDNSIAPSSSLTTSVNIFFPWKLNASCCPTEKHWW